MSTLPGLRDFLFRSVTLQMYCEESVASLSANDRCWVGGGGKRGEGGRGVVSRRKRLRILCKHQARRFAFDGCRLRGERTRGVTHRGREALGRGEGGGRDAAETIADRDGNGGAGRAVRLIAVGDFRKRSSRSRQSWQRLRSLPGRGSDGFYADKIPDKLNNIELVPFLYFSISSLLYFSFNIFNSNEIELETEQAEFF